MLKFNIILDGTQQVYLDKYREFHFFPVGYHVDQTDPLFIRNGVTADIPMKEIQNLLDGELFQESVWKTEGGGCSTTRINRDRTLKFILVE